MKLANITKYFFSFQFSFFFWFFAASTSSPSSSRCCSWWSAVCRITLEALYCSSRTSYPIQPPHPSKTLTSTLWKKFYIYKNMKGMIMPQQQGEADEDFGLWGHEGRRLSNHGTTTSSSQSSPPPPQPPSSSSPVLYYLGDWVKNRSWASLKPGRPTTTKSNCQDQ